MKDSLKKALETSDLPSLRRQLVDIITAHPHRTSTIEDVTQVLGNTDHIFEPDNGRHYPAVSEMTETLMTELRDDLMTNFSLTKFRLYAEALDAGVRPMAKRHRKEADTASETPTDSNQTPRATIGLTLGWIVLILGLITTIVGICVPVRFMIGLGIGIFMLGTAVAYLNVERR